jgi:hypothetical protein
MGGALRLWIIVILGAGALFIGGAVWYAWERVWIWRRLALPEYAVDFRRSLRKADPAMPILAVVCGAAGAGFAALTEGAARAMAINGIGILGLIVAGSIVLAKPINGQFRRRPEGDVPPGAERLRAPWRNLHLIRSGLAVAAYGLFLFAASDHTVTN